MCEEQNKNMPDVHKTSPDHTLDYHATVTSNHNGLQTASITSTCTQPAWPQHHGENTAPEPPNTTTATALLLGNYYQRNSDRKKFLLHQEREREGERAVALAREVIGRLSEGGSAPARLGAPGDGEPRPTEAAPPCTSGETTTVRGGCRASRGHRHPTALPTNWSS